MNKYQLRLVFQMSRSTFPVKRCVGRIILVFELCLKIHFFLGILSIFFRFIWIKPINKNFRLYFICYETSAPRTEEGQGFWDVLICELYFQIDQDFCMFVHLAGVIKRNRKNRFHVVYPKVSFFLGISLCFANFGGKSSECVKKPFFFSAPGKKK